MRHTLLVAALFAVTIPTPGRAADADAEKQVASLSKQCHGGVVKGDTKTLDASPGR